MANQTVPVPDIGGAENVEVIEVSVTAGDIVSEEDTLITLESDKASMDIPSPSAGKVVSVLVSVGDHLSEGSAILELINLSGQEHLEDKSLPSPQTPAPEEKTSTQGVTETSIKVPDIGGAEGVDVIELTVKVGDSVDEGDTLIVLESDKTSMDIPSPAAGKIVSISINEGDKASEGSAILVLESASTDIFMSPTTDAPSAPTNTPARATEASIDKPLQQRPSNSDSPSADAINSATVSQDSFVYAGPAVRKLARQMGINLGEVKTVGPRGRITKDDVKEFVKTRLQKKPENLATTLSSGAGIPQIPEVDFGKFGEVEVAKLSKLSKIIAANMTRNWLNVPHVTQFDDADVTDLEEFRSSMKKEAEKTGVRLTPLPFLLKACAMALNQEPSFNVSLHADGEHIVRKKYVHIGMAVATPTGLVVPVLRDVDKKGLLQLAEEARVLAGKARDGKLLPKDMQGGCFTISSLGAIGGTGFTPIVNSPEVAILGVSKASIQPVWDGKSFMPRQMLPLSLSYDHRAINGADAGRFFTYLTTLLADVRRLSL